MSQELVADATRLPVKIENDALRGRVKINNMWFSYELFEEFEIAMKKGQQFQFEERRIEQDNGETVIVCCIKKLS